MQTPTIIKAATTITTTTTAGVIQTQDLALGRISLRIAIPNRPSLKATITGGIKIAMMTAAEMIAVTEIEMVITIDETCRHGIEAELSNRQHLSRGC
jgi:hypothetical protein